MSTPEGKIKKHVSSLLKSYAPTLYYEMPVPSGFGKSGLDYTGCFYGRFFAIETKAPGKRPTARQLTTIAQMRAAGAKVFIIDGDIGLIELDNWLAAGKQASS